MALVATLLLLSLLVVLCLSVVHATRRHLQLSNLAVEHARDRELADGALRLSILQLSARELKGSGEHRMDIFGQPVHVSVQLESGRIDLNSADDLLLTAAFAGNGYEEAEARTLAARIIDWRDADDIPGPQGAEREQYRSVGRMHGPRNAPFAAVSELLQVLGTEQVDRSLLEVFTVYSQLPGVRQDAAVPFAERALQWAQARRLGDRDWWQDGGRAPGELHIENLIGQVVQLRACAGAPLQTCRTTVVRFTGDRNNPVLTYAWR